MTRVFFVHQILINFIIDGRFGFYGLKAIKLALNSSQLKSYDWIIFLDEDAAILDSKRLLELIHHMRELKILLSLEYEMVVK